MSSTSTPTSRPSRPLRESVAISITRMVPIAHGSRRNQTLLRSMRSQSGVSTSSGTTSMIPRWLGSPVSAFGRKTLAPLTTP